MSKQPSDYDFYLFHEGRHFEAYELLGAHLVEENGTDGVRFTVWAPNAQQVRVTGDFTNWQAANDLIRISGSGLWSAFVPGVSEGSLYKYVIQTPAGEWIVKADPYAFSAESRPGTASKVVRLDRYSWCDEIWNQRKSAKASYREPMVIYEVHAGSWKRKGNGDFLTYRDLAHELVPYIKEMGYTHVELLPLAEHPFDKSWGYQATGYYAPTSRYGSPDDLMYFVDCCHREGIGVILDWAPGHFCKDDHGLRLFDGTPLYESGWAERAENYGWGTLNFDYGRPEVWSFLISNALFWLEKYHIDGLRVDAVASMLYLDYGKDGGWIPNKYGGREHLEAIDFIRKLNETVFERFPQALMLAEESTAWPLVTRPAYVGGLGFNYKWNMGWMNDTLRYMSLDPVYRKYEHHLLTFSFMYAFSENFVLPLSHDEVVHGKKSLLDKMPGDYWQKFANLRAFYVYWMTHPGKKLLFMGGEFGHFIEWNEAQGLDWHLLDYPMHQMLHRFVRELNHFYLNHDMLWQLDHEWRGFEWIDCHDSDQSVISFIRKNEQGHFLVVVINFTPIVRYNYRIGVPAPGLYQEVFNSDASNFGGSGQQMEEGVHAVAGDWLTRPYSMEIKVPPLGAVILAPVVTRR